MKDYFHDLAAHVDSLVGAGEIACSSFSAEHSDFIRFNKSAVRQATNVKQVGWALALMQGKRRIQSHVTLTGNATAARPEVEGMQNVRGIKAVVSNQNTPPTVLARVTINCVNRAARPV